MGLGLVRSDSRRLLLWFGLASLLPALALGWVGWAVVAQGRAEERERAAEAAASALQSVLSDFRREFAQIRVDPSVLDRSGPGGVYLVIERDSLRARHGRRLPYYPVAVADGSSSAEPDPFAAVDRLEYGARDDRGAVRLLESLATSSSPGTRAEALLRLAILHAKAGRPAEALTALSVLETLDGAKAGGLPASLVARQKRIEVLKVSGADQERAAEVARLRRDLIGGRWVLTRPQVELASATASLDMKTLISDDDSAVLAAAASTAWNQWGHSNTEATDPIVDSVQHGSDASLVIRQHAADGVAFLIVPMGTVEERWDAARMDDGSDDIALALTSASGETVLGHSVRDTRETVLPQARTRLPWAVHATDGAGPLRLSSRSGLMLAGITIVFAVVIVSGYVLNRAITKEIRVARLQSEFVSAVSHEFRTPITTIRQLSDLLVHSRVSTAERRQEFYATMLAESERLHRMVENLLDFGKMQSGRFEYRFEAVDILPIVSEAAGSVRRHAEAHGYAIEVSSAPDLPRVQADRESIGHAYRNLIENAVKYSPEQKRIDVRVTNGEGAVRVDVQDRGLGISMAEQTTIFDKFTRGTSAAVAGVKGSGIGLALAQEIVRAHGGDIEVNSVVGQGTTFTVLLPVAPAQ